MVACSCREQGKTIFKRQFLEILLMPFVLLAPKIIWLSNLSTFSVPDEDYSRNV